MATMLDDNTRADICANIAVAQLQRVSRTLTDRIERLESSGRHDDVVQTVLAKHCVIQAIQALEKGAS